MRIREIEDLGPRDAYKARSLDYKDPTKDKKDPDYIDTSDEQIISQAKPIPGSNFKYAYIEHSWVSSSFYIINQNNEVIGAADLRERSLIPDSVYVSRITTEPEYRNQGVAKAIYHTLLFVLNKVIISGSSQTQGGQRNWASMAKMPGVVIQGYMDMSIKQMEKYKEELAQLGAEVHPEWSRDWVTVLTFPVASEGPRMRAAQGNVPLYTPRDQRDFDRGMIAYVPKAKPIPVAAVMQAAKQEKITFFDKIKRLFGLGK